MRDNGSKWEKEKLTAPEWIPSQPSQQQFNIVRRVYQQETLNRDANYQTPNKTFGSQCKKALTSCGLSKCLLNSVPIVKWLPKYQPKRDLVGDLVAGATTAVMHIPQGMAYALLSEAPPIIGLYMAFFPVLIYVIFGTSPHVSMGTFAVACLMAGKVVSQYATNDMASLVDNSTRTLPPELPMEGPIYSPVEVLSAVCLAVGLCQVLMWVLRLGAVCTLLSEPLVSGFTTGASFYVLASQLKDLFGVTIPKYNGNYKIILTVVDISKNLPTLNWVAFAISFVCCLIIALNNELLKPWVGKRTKLPVPIELIAVVLGTLVSKYGGLKENFDVSLVGHIPTGLPVPEIPPVALLSDIAMDAFTITMVTYTISMSMALIFASKDKYEIEANQELLALGASNVFGSFFGCAPICASLSRSYIQYQAGGKTGLTSVVSAMLILFVLLWIGPFFQDLPRCVLASIIVVSLKGMFVQVLDLPKFWKLSKLDAMVWLITFLTVTIINIDIGLVAGLLASVGALFCRSQKPYTCLLGRMPNTDLYLDIKRYRGAEELPGIKIFHYCGGLNFASKNLFRETIYRKVGFMKPEVDHDIHDEDNNLTNSDNYSWDPTIGHKVHCVIIDATALSYVDAPGVKTLVAVKADMTASGITVLLAGANCPVQEMIHTYNTFESEQLQLQTFPTVHDAVVYYRMQEKKKDQEVTLTIPGIVNH